MQPWAQTARTQGQREGDDWAAGRVSCPAVTSKAQASVVRAPLRAVKPPTGVVFVGGRFLEHSRFEP